MLPAMVKAPPVRHMEQARTQHVRDLARGVGCVDLPSALARKYPNAAREWRWQWVFPATRIYVGPAMGERRRHHLHESVLQRAVSTQLRHPPPGERVLYPNGAGAAGAPGRVYHDDLHARAQILGGGNDDEDPGGRALGGTAQRGR
jgi:hypothetical protein